MTEDVFIDDVQITTSVLPPITTSDVVISEFVADNGDGIEDEENDAEDWIELYNGTASPVDLNGWRLTNLATNNAMWTFPSVTIPPFNYLRVFASGKNRTSPVLHTNFTLVKAGGYLALVKPDATTKTSEFNYPQQSEDVSYGTYGVSQVVKFMYPPTPGTSNESASVFAGDGRPSEEVIFNREGGLFSFSFGHYEEAGIWLFGRVCAGEEPDVFCSTRKSLLDDEHFGEFGVAFEILF